jgi:hypothetical protein
MSATGPGRSEPLMKALQFTHFGSPEVLELVEAAPPSVYSTHPTHPQSVPSPVQGSTGVQA